MVTPQAGKRWETTNTTNLLRAARSGAYYARVKIRGRQVWVSLKTKVTSVAKLRIRDVEARLRADAAPAAASAARDDYRFAHFVAAFRERLAQDVALAPATRLRRDVAVKAVLTTWPGLAALDVRRLTPAACREWGARALRDGTRFVPPGSHTTLHGMGPSSFNKSVAALRAILELAREAGAIYRNPAADLTKAPLPATHLALPSPAQFRAIVVTLGNTGSGWAVDAADLVRLLAFSGLRVSEARALRWSHLDRARRELTVPGTKTASALRRVPLFPALDALLAEIAARRGPEAPIAPILHVGTALVSLANACRAHALPVLTHHDLRHLFATRAIESGVDIPTVSRWLGHADGGALAMKTYGHLRREHSQAQALRVSFD